MKSILRLTAALALAAATVGVAHADYRHRHYVHGPRVGIGFAVGPVWGPWYYPPPVYYPSYTVVERVAPPVYVEQSAAQSAPDPAASYWYFCRASNAYYPYVKECTAGWERVAPRPQQP